MAKQLTTTDGRPTHEEISKRAREIYEKSGRRPGRDLENWLEAESQLMADRKTVAVQTAQAQTTTARALLKPVPPRH